MITDEIPIQTPKPKEEKRVQGMRPSLSLLVIEIILKF